jgi:hypothetical protein
VAVVAVALEQVVVPEVLVRQLSPWTFWRLQLLAAMERRQEMQEQLSSHRVLSARQSLRHHRAR